MKSRHILLFLAALAGACADTSGELSSEFRETPFRQLRGVQLGMAGRDLQRIRPDAKYTVFLGLQERIPGYIVSYRFPSAMADSARNVEPNDKLLGVFITQMFETEAAAADEWRKQVSALSSSRRKPDICETFAAGGMQARWFSGKIGLAIGVFAREPVAPNVGPRVIYAVSPSEALKQPEGARPMVCPN
jgi:hypothetical protein